MPEIDHYKTLQVDPSAHRDVIEAAYRRLALIHHPDRDRSPGSTDKMTRINRAYEVLSDPQKRAAYDKRRAARADSPSTSGGGSSALDRVYKPVYEKLKREIASVRRELLRAKEEILSEILRDFGRTGARKRPVTKTKIARMLAKIPEVVMGTGALVTLLGLLLTVRYVPLFTIMLLVGASGLGVGLYELRRRKSNRNRMRPKLIWGLIAVSGLFLVVGLTNVLASSTGPTIVTLGGFAVMGVGLMARRIQSEG